ncbi:hypothetical protein [Streptomyces sp. 8N616]|uniref:hypothetical protein n=1 Tax=Streptomyces sp. 8N616 TaxID=3457414 RepID=UPI003FD0B123
MSMLVSDAHSYDRSDPTGTARQHPRQPHRAHRLGEIEGLQVSLAGAEEKLAQLDNFIACRKATVNLGMPAFPDIVGRHVTAGLQAATHAPPKAHNVGDLGSRRTS